MNQKYTDFEKQDVINSYLSGKSVLSILSKTGIPRSTIYMWIKRHYLNKETENQKEVNLNNFRLLENKVARLKGIIRILQSIDCTVNSTLKEKLNALEPPAWPL